MNRKQDLSLVIGIAIPILMIVLVAASIYLPGLFAPAPTGRFLYVTGDNFYQGSQYVVEQGKLTKRDIKYPEHYAPGVLRLFVHETSANQSREITFEEAQALRLDASAISPDGYEVVYGKSEYGFFPLFFSEGRHDGTLYLRGHHASRKLRLQLPAEDASYYSRRARFIGWIR